jgi:hypothetical protein
VLGVRSDLERHRAALGHLVVGLPALAERAAGPVDLVVADEPVVPVVPGERGHAVVAARGDGPVARPRPGGREAAVVEALGKVQAHDAVGGVRHRADRPVAAVAGRRAGRAGGESAACEDALERAAQRRQAGGGQACALQERAPIGQRHLEPSPGRSTTKSARIATPGEDAAVSG